MAKKPVKKECEFFPVKLMPLNEMPPKRKEAEIIKNRIVEDLAELFKHLDEFSRSTLGFSIVIMALARRKELDDEEKEISEKK